MPSWRSFSGQPCSVSRAPTATSLTTSSRPSSSSTSPRSSAAGSSPARTPPSRHGRSRTASCPCSTSSPRATSRSPSRSTSPPIRSPGSSSWPSASRRSSCSGGSGRPDLPRSTPLNEEREDLVRQEHAAAREAHAPVGALQLARHKGVLEARDRFGRKKRRDFFESVGGDSARQAQAQHQSLLTSGKIFLFLFGRRDGRDALPRVPEVFGQHSRIRIALSSVVRVRPDAEAENGRERPVLQVVPALESRPRPVRELVARHVHRRQALVHCLPPVRHLVVIREELRPLLLKGDEARRLLQLEKINGQMSDSRGQEPVDAPKQSLARLSRNADHQVGRDVPENARGFRHGPTRGRGVVPPLQGKELGVHERLHADGQAVYPDSPKG